MYIFLRGIMNKKVKYFIIILILLFNINFFYNTLLKRNFYYSHNFDSRHYSGVIASDLYNIYTSQGVSELKYRFPDYHIIDDIIVIKKSYQKFKDNSYVLECELRYNYIKNEVLLPNCKTTKIFKEESIWLLQNNYNKIYDSDKLIIELENKIGLESINDFITLLVSGYYNEYFYKVSKDESYNKLSNSNETNYRSAMNILNSYYITEIKGYNVTKIYEEKDLKNKKNFAEYNINNKLFTCKVNVINLLLMNKLVEWQPYQWHKLKIDSNCNLN